MIVKAGVGSLTFVNHETIAKVARILGGEEAVEIAKVLSQVEEITDEEIVAKTDIKLNSVRKILYKLYDHSLVGLRRTRDKNTGWFIFHWRLQPDQIDGFLTNQKRRILEKLETRLKYEQTHEFYFCNTPGCRQIPFEEATEYVFRCPKCDKRLMHFDNSKIIEFLSKKVKQLRSELSEQ
ncbi:transcription factor [Candidatus Bathyarchaeota archaeon ex4484_231]|nr:MAG: transcription factor [Candidatus Bathyarchaeota archaeon ex4484_231]RJS75822.1 MAG: transcription factor [Candidatus Bathyarchaeota archaeon]